jgi:hypothetical protein
MSFLKVYSQLATIFILLSNVNAQDIPMLERKLAYPDSITHLPYTNLCLITDAQLPLNYNGWVMDYEIIENKHRTLLIIEMNSSEVWGFKYCGGSLQLIIEIPFVRKSFKFDLNSDKIKIHSINNYGGPMGISNPPVGSLSISKIDDKIMLNGKVRLTTSNPYTMQVAEFKNSLIPIYSILQFQSLSKEKQNEREKQEEEMVQIFANALRISDSLNIADKKVKQTETKDAIGQEFYLSLSSIGLGSGRFHPDRIIITVKDSLLRYGIMEPSSEVDFISYSTGDTSWKEKRVWYQVPFERASRDSILAALSGKEGQDIYRSNPDIMSGGIKLLYVEYKGWCTHLSNRNIFDKTSNQIAKYLDPYLPEDYKLYCDTNHYASQRSFRIDYWESKSEPLIKKCIGLKSKSSTDLIGNEYEWLKNQETD